MDQNTSTQTFCLKLVFNLTAPHFRQAQVQSKKFEPFQGQKTSTICGCLYHPSYKGSGQKKVHDGGRRASERWDNFCS